MNKQEAKKHLDVITAFAEGKTIWVYSKHIKEWLEIEQFPYDKEERVYAIEDKHFEARKAFALGEPIEWYINSTLGWAKCSDVSWQDDCEYRPTKHKEWYDNIIKPILCWVSNENANKKVKALMVSDYNGTVFKSAWNEKWKHATPVSEEDLLKV